MGRRNDRKIKEYYLFFYTTWTWFSSVKPIKSIDWYCYNINQIIALPRPSPEGEEEAEGEREKEKEWE